VAPLDSAAPAVLLVDDEHCIRTSVSRVLARAGYAVALAASGAEALERVAAQAYAAVICDLRMPGLSGMVLYDRLLEVAPGLTGHILVASGDLTRPDIAGFLRRTGAPTLPKPYATRDLLEALSHLCPPPAGRPSAAPTVRPEQLRAAS
jgi:CheY-like chemotaxis protein